MSTAPKRQATLDELAYLRDRGHAVELIDGEIVYKAMPTPAHGSAPFVVAGRASSRRAQSGALPPPRGEQRSMAREIVAPVAGHPASPLRLECAMKRCHETETSRVRRILDFVGP